MTFEEFKEYIRLAVEKKLDYISNNVEEEKEKLILEFNSIAEQKYNNERQAIEKKLVNEESFKEMKSVLIHDFVRETAIKYIISTIKNEKTYKENISKIIEKQLFNFEHYKILYEESLTYKLIIDNLRYEYRINLNRMGLFVGKNPQKRIYVILFYVFIPFLWIPGIIRLIKEMKNKKNLRKRLLSNETEVLLRAIYFSEKYSNPISNREFM